MVNIVEYCVERDHPLQPWRSSLAGLVAAYHGVQLRTLHKAPQDLDELLLLGPEESVVAAGAHFEALVDALQEGVERQMQEPSWRTAFLEAASERLGTRIAWEIRRRGEGAVRGGIGVARRRAEDLVRGMRPPKGVSQLERGAWVAGTLLGQRIPVVPVVEEASADS